MQPHGGACCHDPARYKEYYWYSHQISIIITTIDLLYNITRDAYRRILKWVKFCPHKPVMLYIIIIACICYLNPFSFHLTFCCCPIFLCRLPCLPSVFDFNKTFTINSCTCFFFSLVMIHNLLTLNFQKFQKDSTPNDPI